jgi:transcriptional regulator with XRE-family HTH domain
MTVTAAQSRAARGLLGMTQVQLAIASGVSLSTIAHFEIGRRRPTLDHLTALQRALEAAGIDFLDENGGGVGVRLKKDGWRNQPQDVTPKKSPARRRS